MEIQSTYGMINGSPIIQALSLFIESREHKLKRFMNSYLRMECPGTHKLFGITSLFMIKMQ